jgi:hypothetical protein
LYRISLNVDFECLCHKSFVGSRRVEAGRWNRPGRVSRPASRMHFRQNVYCAVM